MCSLPPEYSLLHMTKWCLHSQWSCPQVLLHGWCFLGVDTFWGNRKYFEETTVHLPDKCIHPLLSPLCNLPGICNRALTPDHRETARDKLIHKLQRHFSTLFDRKHTWWLLFQRSIARSMPRLSLFCCKSWKFQTSSPAASRCWSITGESELVALVLRQYRMPWCSPCPSLCEEGFWLSKLRVPNATAASRFPIAGYPICSQQF